MIGPKSKIKKCKEAAEVDKTIDNSLVLSNTEKTPSKTKFIFDPIPAFSFCRLIWSRSW
jgi:hypothetical protein